MNNIPNDGGPAFPFSYEDRRLGGTCNTIVSDGMTLRDYFAGQAMVGMLSHPDTKFDEDHDMVEQMRIGPWLIADAMIAAREAKPAVKP